MTDVALPGLVVSLQADIARFSTDLNRAAGVADRAMGQIGRAASLAKTALGSIVVPAAVGTAALIELTKNGVAAASALDDLADSTGSSIEELSRLQNVAKVSGVAAAEFTANVNRLAAGLAGADEEANKVGAALNALGVNARDPAQALQEVATRLNAFADGIGKAAIARDLFGRNGVQFLAYLKDLAEDTRTGSTVTAEMARESEKLEKEWRRLELAGDALAQKVAGAVVPVFNQLIDRWRSLIGITGSVREAIGAALSVANVGGVANINEAIAKTEQEIAKLKASLDDRRGSTWAKAVSEDIAEAERRLRALVELRRQSTNYDDREPGGSTFRQPQLNYVSAEEQARRAAAAERARAEAIREATRRYDDFTEAIRRNMRADEQASREFWENRERGERALADFIYARHEDMRAAQAAIDAYREETKAIGATTDELERLALARAEESLERRISLGWGEEAIRLWREETAAIRERYQAIRENAQPALRRVEDDFTSTFDRIGDVIYDALMRGFRGGSDGLRDILAQLASFGAQTFLRPQLNQLTSSFGRGGFGGFPSSWFGTAAGGSLLPSWLGPNNTPLGSAESSLFGGTTGAGAGFFSTPSLSGILGGLGTGSVVGSLMSGLFGQRQQQGVQTGAQLGAAVGSFIPGVGTLLGAVIGSLVGSLFKSGGGPKTGGFASNVSGLDRFFTPSDKDAELAQLVDAQASAFRSVLRELGGRGAAGFGFGFDVDPQGDAASRISVGAFVGGREVFGVRDLDVGRDEAQLRAALDVAAKRALLAALQASELPQAVAAVLNSITAATASAGDVDRVLAFGSAMRTITDSLGGLSDFEATIARLNQGPVESLRDAGTALLDMASQFDGTVEATHELAAATAEYYDSLVRTVATIRQLRQDIEQMFLGTFESIYLSNRDPSFVNEYLQGRADNLYGQVATSSDPEAIARFAQEFNQILLAAFNLRTPDQQVTDREHFINSISRFNDLVSARLSEIEGVTRSNGRNVLEVASDTISDAAQAMRAAADVQQQAAETQLVAATTPVQVEVVLAGSGRVNG